MSNILYACNVVQYHHKKCLDWDFPGGPVVKTLCFHCRGRGFDPWLGKFRIPHRVAKKKKKKKECPDYIKENAIWVLLFYEKVDKDTNLNPLK